MRAFVIGLLVCSGWLAGLAPATLAGESPALPADRDARFLGVATCGSSECHGSATPWRNATVTMKERLIWDKYDPHARAFSSLTSEQGQRIARNLAIPDSAQAPACLTCHSTFVPSAQRGPRFKLEDGVGCESCHGPGGQFLTTHMQPTSQHLSNLEAGLYPTTDPRARAVLCLSCHQGDAKRRMTHQLYGAGHPRLRFELDTYSALQPYHVVVDADYRRRKPVSTSFARWSQGQLASASALLRALADTPTSQGLFPELSHFDCHACHHRLGEDPDYRPRAGSAAGKLPHQDTPLLVTRALSMVVAPTQSDRLRELTRALQGAIIPGARSEALRRLADELREIERLLAARTPQAGDNRAVARALLALVREENPLAFSTAEAAVMAWATLLTADFEEARLAASGYAAASRALDEVYAQVRDEATYRPQAFAASLTTLASLLEKN